MEDNKQTEVPGSTNSSTEQVAVQIPEQNPYGKRNWKKWILIYVGIALLLYGGVFYFFLNKSSNPYSSNYPSPTVAKTPTAIPTVNPTANWKSYTSQYGFEIKYPDNWGMMECPKGKLIDPPIIGPEFFTNPTALCNTDISPTVGFSVSDAIKLTPGFETSSSKNILIEGKNAEYFVFKNNGQAPGPNEFIEVYISHKNKYIVASVYNTDYITTFDKILSTFKFIDQGSSVDTSNWKTYTNASGKYSLKYPSNLILKEEELTVSLYSHQDHRISSVIAVYIEENPKNLTVEQFVDQNVVNPPAKTYNSIIIDGIVGKRTKDIPGSVMGDWVFIPKDGKYYQISWNDGTNSISKDIFDQILQTFTFIP